MPRGFSKGLRETVSRIGKSIRRSNDEELPESSSETPDGTSMARTNYSASTESSHAGALTSAASDSQLGDSIPRSFPSTNDPSARSDAPSGASKIKANRVHDDPFEPLLELLRQNKVLQEIEPSLHEDPDEGVYQAFVDAVQKCYEQDLNSREDVIGAKVYNIKVADTAKQEVSIDILEGKPTFTSVYFYLVGKGIDNPKTKVRHYKHGLKVQHVRKGENQMSAEAVLAEIERREHVIKPAMTATSDGRVAWVLRRSGHEHQDFGWFYDVHGLISEGDRGPGPT